MPIESIQIQAGVYRHGTDLEGAGRWRDVNLVRWRSGSLQPIGGWQRRTKSGTTESFTATNLQTQFTYTFASPDRDTQISVFKNSNLLSPSIYSVNLVSKTVTLLFACDAGDIVDIKLTLLDKPARGALAWVDNSFNSRMVVGTYEKLFAITSGNVVSDITPTNSDYSEGNESATEQIGYGNQEYGLGYYGTERESSGVFQEATTWALDSWGEYLVACSVDDGFLYEWTLTGTAAKISNAPTDNLSLVTTAERFLFALGAGGNPRKVQWCDKENNTVWTPAATNEAGDFELPTNGEILSGHRLRGKTLILTTADAHTASYIGPQLVFQFEKVGTACGAISRHACVAYMEGAYWMGSKGFFMYNGSSVQEMQCDVLDYVFTDINRSQRSKVFAMNNSEYGEAWWFYPSATSNENDRYVLYNYKENYWSIGELSRTAGVDSGVFRQPIMFAADGKIYDHEIGFDHDGSAPYAESGPVLFGSNIVKVNEIIPDEKTQGEATLTFKTRFYPNGDESTHGPYTMSNPVSARFSGRQLRIRVNGTEYNDWRFGVPRLNLMPGGKR